MTKKIYFKLSILFALFLAINCQNVPCNSEVFIDDYYGIKTQREPVAFDLSQDIAFKKTNRFSFSFWLHKDAAFSFKVEVGSSAQKSELIKFEASQITTPKQQQVIISSPKSTQTPRSITQNLTKLWTYIFITLDIGITGQQSIYLYYSNEIDSTKDEPKIIENQCPIVISETTFVYEKIEIPIIAPIDNVFTRQIYFHRGYGIYDIKQGDKNEIIKMMMRDNTKLISNFLFNQDILQKYMNDNNENIQNNINLINQKTAEIPQLFYKSMNFYKKNQIKLNGLHMSQIQREFTISFSVQSQVIDAINPYTLVSIQDDQGTSIISIILKYESEFEETVSLSFSNDKQITPCKVRRLKYWNYFVISGYSYARLETNYLPLKYYFDIYIDQSKCQTALPITFQEKLQSDYYYLVFGSQFSEYSGFFSLKALKIYEGAYAPQSSGCNSLCFIQQSREYTDTEKLKKSGSTASTPSLQQLANLQIKDYQSLSCIRCNNNMYMTGEYCVPNASSCTDSIDSSSLHCYPQSLCSDPLHDSTDCIKNCKPGYSIDNSAKCSIKCGYTCSKCSRTTEMGECISDDENNPNAACPSTRTFNATTKKCDCNQNLNDDGVTTDCISPSTVTNTVASEIKYVFDIYYDTTTNKTKAQMTSTSINNKSGPTLVYSQGSSTDTAVADLDYGIQLYSEKYFYIKDFTEMMPMKFWLRVLTDLGRFVKLVTYFDSSNKPIIRVMIDQINNFEYSITVCLYGRCQLISPQEVKIKVEEQNLIAISMNQNNLDSYTITLFVNAVYKIIKFEKSQSDPLTNDIIKTIQFGDLSNKYASPIGSYFSVRYITFYTQYFTYTKTIPNCLVNSGKMCIFCKKGYYFESYESGICSEKPIDLSKQYKFTFDGIQMIHTCALNKNICISCKDSPSLCDECVSGTGRDKKYNCDCEPGKYSDFNYQCQACSPQCETCKDESTKCITCRGNRINSPICNCPDSYLEPESEEDKQKGLCETCSKTCSSCISGQCQCPDLTKTFRLKEKRSCPCKQGYYDETESNTVCKQCFANCLTCQNGNENSCKICKVDPSQVDLVLTRTTEIGECSCKDSTQYLDYLGFCRSYVSAKLSLISDLYFRRPRIRIELPEGQELEEASQSKWLSLLDIRIKTNDNKESSSDENNLVLTAENDKDHSNVGYINIDVIKSCYSRLLEIEITTNRAIRTKNGVPLKPEFSGVIISFKVSPFILKFNNDDLEAYEKQEKALRQLQDNGFISFMRYISLMLFFMNCLQPIATLLLINTSIPLKSHLLISQFASFIFPHTPIWMNYELDNVESNGYRSPPYTIYGGEVTVEDQLAFSPYQQIGMSANFFVNITETLVLLAINGIVIAGLKYLDESQVKFFQGKRYYQYGISFLLNLMEVRLIYILISIFLQFTNLNFANGLNGASAIFSFIFLILYILFLYIVGKTLNSPSEKEDFEYRRMQHLIDFLDISKHSVTLNYKFINTIKKIIYFFILIIMYNSPKVSIIFLIIVSVLSMMFDILSRPFRINWINSLKIVSSLSWSSLLIALMISYNQKDKMEQFDYIIDDSTFENFQKSGEAIFYLTWIFFTLNCGILILKCLDMIHKLYTYIIERGKQDQVQLIIKEKQGIDDKEGIQKNIAFQTYNSITDSNDNGVFPKIAVKAKQAAKTNNYLFNLDNLYQQEKNRNVKQPRFQL